MLSRLIADVPWTLVGGKGGVGKTTVAAALALARADDGLRTLVLSTDPAHSLGDALGQPLSAEPQPVRGVPNLLALEVDAERDRQDWLARWRGALSELLEGGTLLSAADIDELLDLSLPGADELAALLRLAELIDRADIDRLIIDTAPTGHALRLIETPALAAEWVNALGQLDEHRRTVAEALTRRPLQANDLVRQFLDELQRDVAALSERLRDPQRTGCVLVTTPEPVVLAETGRLREALGRAGIAVGTLVVNRARGESTRWRAVAPADLPVVFVPQLDQDPQGIDALRGVAAVATPEEQAATLPQRGGTSGATAAHHVVVGARWTPPRDRTLYIVAGKGGVGKTTFASALAAHSAVEASRRTLLFSVDPAGSLGDVWGSEVGDAPTAAPGCGGLTLRQLDASSRWHQAGAEDGGELVSILSDVIGGGAREVSSQLPDLAPPGIDELVALAELARQLEEPDFDVVVLDTAPTGHFLRLVEAPGLALQWAHAILRLMLRYRNVQALGDAAERVLRFAHEVKRLGALMRDASRTFVAVVALPEALSVPETHRLLTRLSTEGVYAGALVINRLLHAGEVPPDQRMRLTQAMMTMEGCPPAVGAPSLEHGPVGLDELLALSAGWRHLELPSAGAFAA